MKDVEQGPNASTSQVILILSWVFCVQGMTTLRRSVRCTDFNVGRVAMLTLVAQKSMWYDIKKVFNLQGGLHMVEL